MRTETDSSLQWIQCPLCRTDRADIAWVKNGYTIVACRACGVRYVNPRPTPEKLARFYREEYFDGSTDDAPGAPHLQQRAMKLATARLRLGLLQRYRAVGRLLDIGCGGGFLVEAACAAGWNAIGMDAGAAGQPRASLEDISVVAGRAEAAPFRAAQFQVVVAIDILEHVFCPRTFLAQARQLLEPGGLLLIETPNMSGWMPRLLGSRHPWVRPPEHLNYFTPPTLRALLQQTGFHVEQLQRSAQKALTLEYVLGLTGATNPFVTRLVKACVGRFAALRQQSFSVPLDVLLAVAST